MMACASGGDYQFDEATGLVAAMILGGAQLVTATLWSLPTTAGYRQFAPGADDHDPMAEAIIAVDRAHEDPDAGRAVNRWQREQMRRWRAATPAPARCMGGPPSPSTCAEASPGRHATATADSRDR
jgi:hypothetical protein